jgi:hypothetical protein
VPADRPYGHNSAYLVVGVVTSRFEPFPDGLSRVLLVGDPTRGMGSLAEPECRRIIAAIDLAEREGMAVEWVAVSSGARIAMDSGTENLDWTARVLARIVRFTQARADRSTSSWTASTSAPRATGTPRPRCSSTAAAR